jgi:SIT4-associating protein SAP185/190
LIAFLAPDQSTSTQTSAGDFLKAIITISANATTQDQSVIGPNELTRQLVSESCLEQLIDFMLQGGNPLTVGVGIIIEVIRKNNSDYDLENQIGPVPKNSDPIYLGTLLRQFANHIPKFMDLVNSPSQIVTRRDGSTTTKKRELKTAFGEKIEPLGFDRFKTCELMAELLHCSNMALLNERGSEAEVRRRDAERERLKADGKLTSATAGNLGDLGDFSTSVDSQGFHHARAPSMDSPAEIKPLQVQNSSEDDFEKVIAPEVATETSKDTASEKEQIGEPLERSPKVAPRDAPKEPTSGKTAGDDGEFVDEPLTPPQDSTASAETPTSPAKPADDAESPTTAGLSAEVGGLDLDNDTVMNDRQESSEPAKTDTEAKTPPSLLTQQLNQTSHPSISEPETLSPHPDDKPAPLFAGKKRESNAEPDKIDTTRFTAPVPDEDLSEITPIDEQSVRSVVFGSTEDSVGFEIDIDGTPVVGDLLKITFVENKVVPTILVSSTSTPLPVDN